MKYTVLVVDDDAEFLKRFAIVASTLFTLETARTFDEGLAAACNSSWDTVLLDVDLAEARTGLDLLRRILAQRPDQPVIMLSGDENVGTVVEAMRGGARDYLPKPPDLALLEAKVRKCVEDTAWRQRAREAIDDGSLVGTSGAMARLREEISRLGPVSLRVLLRGESGTGKELVAHAIHEAGPRRSQPLVCINAAGEADDLFESRLFGHEKGAFTGATERRRGALEVADGGTLFLDEVGKMGVGRQAKLLRVLETGAFHRVGGNDLIGVDVRWILASNEDLEQAIAEGKFARDFYHRIHEYELRVPSLRERLEDLPELAEHLLLRFCVREGWEPRRFAPDALGYLLDYTWPGNVRELDTVVKYAAVLAGETIEADAVQVALSRNRLDLRNPVGPRALKDAHAEWERGFLLAALIRNGRSKHAAAEDLEIGRSTLYKKLEDHGIDVSEQ